MNRLNPIAWVRHLRDLPNSSPLKSVLVVLLVAVTCAIIVSVTAVKLRPLQQANMEAERQARLAAVFEALPGNGGNGKGAPSIETFLVDLATGSIVTGRNPQSYDQRAAAADPGSSVAIPENADIAGIGRRAPYGLVHLVRRRAETELVILPVRGAGYQSMLYGYLALRADLKTVAALTFYQQAETPGLGDKIMSPAWLSKWPGTSLVDETGTLRVAVAKGESKGRFEVDGISGATRTGNGVTHMLRFWLGDRGYGPFLKRLAAGEVKP